MPAKNRHAKTDIILGALAFFVVGGLCFKGFYTLYVDESASALKNVSDNNH